MMITLSSALKTIGVIPLFLCGLALWPLQVYWGLQWFGVIGGVIGFLASPLVAVTIFPIVFFAVEGFSGSTAIISVVTWAAMSLCAIGGVLDPSPDNNPEK